jgi:pimeloyl-ACP methyl ester carboxylesterase
MTAPLDLSFTEQDLTREAWGAALRALGDTHGFYEEIGDEHTALFVKSGKTLIISFENLDHVYEDGNRLPWGFDFVQKQGWSILGMMAHGWTWYRHEDVYAFFNRLRDEGFFAQFDRVVFYGASMGGYAACAFSAACPGATVVAISPQASLDRDLCSWERRYQLVWSRDFTSQYGYAPEMSAKAEQVYIFYDPLEPPDAMHAALFQNPNVIKFKCRFQGHRIASGFVKMGILKQVVTGCVDGTLDRHGFYKLLRARRGFKRYLRELMQRINETKHPLRVAIVANHTLAMGRAPVFRRKKNAADKLLRKRGLTPPGEDMGVDL